MPSPGRYPYGKLSNYERLRPEDVKVWEKYMAANPNKPWRMDYDVKVGLGRTPLEDLSPELQKDWKDLTRKRIDCVAWDAADIYIIEVKPMASLGALGQLLGYSQLWEDFHNSGRRVRPLLVCSSLDPDTARVAQASGIEISVV